jgi:AI-2 transport protein TqsA
MTAEQTDRNVRTTCVLVLTVIALGMALSLLRPVLVPFLLALLLTYSLTPVIDLQVRYLHFPRSLALVGVGIAGLLISLLMMYLTAAAIGEIAEHVDEYRQELARLTAKAVAFLDGIGIHPKSEDARRALAITEKMGQQFLATLLNGLTEFLTTSTLVVIFMVFLLLGRTGPVPDPTSLLGEIGSRVRRYLVRLVSLSVLTGLLVGLALMLLGVRFALVFGFLAFLLNFIPNIGALIATLLPLPIVILSPDLSITEQVLALVVPAGIQFFIGSLIQPRLYGGALNLHPVTVLLALVFFGMIWGIIGAFLAMPITGVIKIVIDRIPATRPIGQLMAGDLSILSQPLVLDDSKDG